MDSSEKYSFFRMCNCGVAAASLLAVGVAAQAGSNAAVMRRECAKFLEDYEFTSRDDAYAEESLALFRTCLHELRAHGARSRSTMVGGVHFPTMVTRHANGPPVLARRLAEEKECEAEEPGYLNRCCGDAASGNLVQTCWKGEEARRRQCCDPPGPSFIFITPAMDVNVGSRMRNQGTFMVQQSYALQSLVGPGDVVIDAGANIGAYTIPLAAHVGPSGLVYAFEPFRKLFQILCGNVAVNGLSNVHAVHAALGAKEERVQVRSPDLSTFNLPSSMQVKHQGYSQGARNWTLFYEPDTFEDVVITTIDSLRLTSLKLVKVDVEDMEHEVIAGARDTLLRLRPLVWAENARLFEHGDQAFVQAIGALGYECGPVPDMDWELLCQFRG